MLCFVVVTQSFIMNSHEVFIHIHQGCFAGTGAIVRLPQCQWSKPDGYGKINQCITTTEHSKAKTVCIFLGIYCIGKIFLREYHHDCWCPDNLRRHVINRTGLHWLCRINYHLSKLKNDGKCKYKFYVSLRNATWQSLMVSFYHMRRCIPDCNM